MLASLDCLVLCYAEAFHSEAEEAVQFLCLNCSIDSAYCTYVVMRLRGYLCIPSFAFGSVGFGVVVCNWEQTVFEDVTDAGCSRVHCR